MIAYGCTMEENYAEGKTHCYYVIANGNRLYYVDMAEAMRERIDERLCSE